MVFFHKIQQVISYTGTKRACIRRQFPFMPKRTEAANSAVRLYSNDMVGQLIFN